MRTYAFSLLWIIGMSNTSLGQGQIKDYISVIDAVGEQPLSFVHDKLEAYDLLIFDDALHLAKEPFDFYNEVAKSDFSEKDGLIFFLEVFSITSQPHLDAYLASDNKDSTLLLPALQNDFSGMGWKYQTYLDLLGTIWQINQSLQKDKKIIVRGVDQPIYWEAIKTRKDYDLFQQSLIGRDYFMYKIITKEMENFEVGKKGIFLTNTRHAYKHIRKKTGDFYWNTGTFFNQWHIGKTYSIRFHNVTLSIQKESNKESSSTEGLDNYQYKWVQMEEGLWEKTFEKNGNLPVAIPLSNNVFGSASYVGNHMLDVKENQTMYDAYDAVIFLAPLAELTFSAKMDFIYTPTFKSELARRILMLNEGKTEEFFKEHNVPNIEAYIEVLVRPEAVKKNYLIPQD